MPDEKPGGTGGPLLVVTGGPLDGSEYPLARDAEQVVLGSSMDADVQILLGNVEPAHAWIAISGQRLALSDAGSATGTFVNGERIEGERVLRDGDQICLGSPGAKGSAKLTVVLSPPHRPATTPARPAPIPVAGPAPATRGKDLDDFLAQTVVPLTTPRATDDDGDELLLPVEADLGPSSAPPLAGGLFKAPLPQAPPHEALPTLAAAELPRLADTPLGGAAPSAARIGIPAPPPPAPAAPPPAAFPPPAPAPPPPAAAAPSPPPTPARPAASPNAMPPLIPPPPLVPPPPRRAEPRAETPAKGVSQPFPPLRPAAGKGASGGGHRSAKRRSLLPSIPVLPVAGVAIALVLLALAWRLIPRGSKPPVAERPQAAASGTTTAAQPTGIEPEVAAPGQTILIRGAGLAAPGLRVTIAGKEATSTQPAPEGLRVVVPPIELPEGAATTVAVQAAGRPTRTFELMLGRLPLLLGLEPLRARVGDAVKIRGRGFDVQPRGNAVTFGTQRALVLSAKPDQLEVVVPAGVPLDAPEMPVAVTVAGRASNTPLSFQLSRAGGGQYRPRFFPDAVTEYPRDELAFVSSELGPLLLLGGADGLESVGARALGVSAALNAIVEAAGSTPPVFELREGSPPGLAVQGQPRPFVRVTAQDAAAYSRAWDGRARPTSASAVARHWTALLQDYLGLFLARQRPTRMLTLSTRARALADIYSEANRRAPGENSVPASLALGAPPATVSALRQLALVVSGEAPRAAVVVEGRWEGRFEDPDQGPRTFQAQLHAPKGTLEGTLTTMAGSIEVRSPLRELGFDRGTLRFTADLQGTPYRFKGTLSGSQVSGTIERQGRPALPFTMQFLD